MADQTITPRAFTLPNQVIELAAGSYEDLTSSNDGIFAVPKDGKYLIHLIDASGGAVVTIQHGDGPLAGKGDLVSSAAAALGGTAAVMTIALHNFAVIESARFKWLTQDDGVISGDTGMLGMIRIATTANIKAAVIVLP